MRMMRWSRIIIVVRSEYEIRLNGMLDEMSDTEKKVQKVQQLVTFPFHYKAKP